MSIIMDNQSTIKLSMNRPALDRLLGGDSKLEMELKHAAVKEIVDKHFVTVIQNEAMDAYKHEVAAKIEENLKTEMGVMNTRNWRHLFVLSSSAEEVVREEVKKGVQASISEIVDKMDIGSIIEERLTREVDARIRTGVRKRLDELYKQG